MAKKHAKEIREIKDIFSNPDALINSKKEWSIFEEIEEEVKKKKYKS